MKTTAQYRHTAAIRLLCSTIVFFLITLLLIPLAATAENADIWKALGSENHFAIIRHAIAPGVGDPANFTLGKCETQRNLSAEGRRQAKEIGEKFRQNGVTNASVYTSQWCRCIETAELFGLGVVLELPVLNSFFRQFEKESEQTAALRIWLLEQNLDQPLILVSHQVNITAFTGIFPGSGEIVVVKRTATGNFNVIGSITTD